ARFNDALPFEHLTVCAGKLLSSEGSFAVIIPKKEEGRFTALASSSGLFPKRICHVQGKSNTPIKRSMMEFTFVKGPVETTSLIIENSRHDYTLEYRELVQDFYLKM
ncbi:MAG: tRNA (adenine-N(6)-)-methyltransferase, partial [Bacteroidia bacterium]|nr:tRNA (adenine-N(6)-)-methyltransferase [Bacteroidia bacterium]